MIANNNIINIKFENGEIHTIDYMHNNIYVLECNSIGEKIKRIKFTNESGKVTIVEYEENNTNKKMIPCKILNESNSLLIDNGIDIMKIIINNVNKYYDSGKIIDEHEIDQDTNRKIPNKNDAIVAWVGRISEEVEMLKGIIRDMEYKCRAKQ